MSTIIEMLGGSWEVEFVSDFENKAIWRALEEVFSRSKLLECGFH